ncbi:hypothetical protein [Saccharicrinis aurantiacus]|uniref:hypothetical protein n=1 Tax=Saccharicrinis aurantiacus TaxID=1849719 RepID=UPI0024926734|nr:hypothetical protein [Saccharicrinis aurantiacus]
MDNLLSGVGSCFGTGPGFAVTAFIALGNDFWARQFAEFSERALAACGIPWEILASHDKGRNLIFPEFSHFLFQYKQEENEGFFDKNIEFTSIRIVRESAAEDIFGFKPSFVNYMAADQPNNVCRTRYSDVYPR